jgi:hypothetical protein
VTITELERERVRLLMTMACTRIGGDGELRYYFSRFEKENVRHRSKVHYRRDEKGVADQIEAHSRSL